MIPSWARLAGAGSRQRGYCGPQEAVKCTHDPRHHPAIYVAETPYMLQRWFGTPPTCTHMYLYRLVLVRYMVRRRRRQASQIGSGQHEMSDGKDGDYMCRPMMQCWAG
jgi:hypothetical protein